MSYNFLMFTSSGQNILFYASIGLIVGLGLFFSRSMDRDAEHYYRSDFSQNGMMAFSILLFVLFAGLIIFLPSLSAHSSNVIFSVAVGLSIVVPLLFIRKIADVFGRVVLHISPTIEFSLNLLVLIFLCSVQLMVLVQVSDFIITQYYSGAHFAMLAVLIIGAGVYTMAGGIRAVVYSNVFIGVITFVTLALIVANDFIFHYPMAFSLRASVVTGSEIFRSAGLSESSLITTVIGIGVMMTWVVWMVLTGLTRKWTADVVHTNVRPFVIVAWFLFALLTGILFLSSTPSASLTEIVGEASVTVNNMIGMGLLFGLTGTFAITFHMIGSLVATYLFPFMRKTKSDEEQILVGRLSIVVVVLLSISYITFTRLSDYRTVIWYINFIAFFSTPVIVSFLTASFAKKGIVMGFVIGLVMGELYALFEVIGQYVEIHSSFLGSASAYAFTIEIALVTFVAGVGTARLSEMESIRRFLMRVNLL